jgi:hypothetical protein
MARVQPLQDFGFEWFDDEKIHAIVRARRYQGGRVAGR